MEENKLGGARQMREIEQFALRGPSFRGAASCDRFVTTCTRDGRLVGAWEQLALHNSIQGNTITHAHCTSRCTPAGYHLNSYRLPPAGYIATPQRLLHPVPLSTNPAHLWLRKNVAATGCPRPCFSAKLRVLKPLRPIDSPPEGSDT